MDGVCEGKDSSFPLLATLDAFHEQQRRTEGGEEFVFYDGSPLVTGLPHYGYILAGNIKDVLTRHQSMRGRYVSRRFGWNCHDLPVEFEIDGRRQVFDLDIDIDIDEYNETCRCIFTKYLSGWDVVFTRSGRWIDFKNGYKTIDLNFMENVCWVFVQLWEKDLIYKGFKTTGLVAVDDDGCSIEKISDFKGPFVKAVDKDIISAVKDKRRLVSKGSIEHSYPFCLGLLFIKLFQAGLSRLRRLSTSCWNVTRRPTGCLTLLRNIFFYNWLEGACYWAVGRSRFWCTPFPLWMSQDGEEIVVMDSIEKLEKLSGVKVTDLHRHYVDDITIPSKKGPEIRVLKCVDDVSDCWFESGSMPYAYIHYPFENQELFEKNFPGNFVAEGLDQVCGWFYTLMVLSTSLFGKPAFKNLLCNGLVLAEDGKKMSKSKNNYPSPKDLIVKYGVDSLRLYLINSPVVHAEPLRFRSSGTYDVVKYVFLPWYNAYRFFVQNAKRLEIEGLASFSLMEQLVLLKSANLDHCINSASGSLVSFVREVVPNLVKYIDYLTNIYEGCRISLSTLYHVLVTTCVFMAPFTPFFTQVLYQNAQKASSKSESIHFCKFPNTTGERDETIIDLARDIREWHNKTLKTPIKEMIVVHPNNQLLEDITGKLEEYVREDRKNLKQQDMQPKMDNIVTFFVRVEGTSIPVRQNVSTTTTKMVVEHAFSRKGIRDYDWFAVYLGKVLCEDKLLSEYKVCSNATIHVRVRARAGRERRIQCTTFDDEMKDVDRFVDIKLSKSLKNTETEADIATFLSEISQHYARQVLITLCRVHFRKKCFNGKFNSSQILFHEGRAVFDESCEEEDFSEQGCRADFLVIALLFRHYFLNSGKYPLYVNDLVLYLETCPLGVNSNSVEAIALLVNHPALTSFVERIAQCSTLDDMVERLKPDEMVEFAEAVGSSFSWGEIATVVPAMLDVLAYDPRREGKHGKSKPAQDKDAPWREGKHGKSKRKSKPAQDKDEENAYYTEDPRSCLKFSRNYFKHVPVWLFLVRVEAAFSLNLEKFLPQLLRDIVMKFKGPSTFDIVILLGDHIADRKRKRVDTENLELAEEMAPPAKKAKISFSLNVKKKCALSGFQFGRS